MEKLIKSYTSQHPLEKHTTYCLVTYCNICSPPPLSQHKGDLVYNIIQLQPKGI